MERIRTTQDAVVETRIKATGIYRLSLDGAKGGAPFAFVYFLFLWANKGKVSVQHGVPWMERIRTTPGAVVEMLCRKVREDNFLFPQIFEKIRAPSGSHPTGELILNRVCSHKF